MKILVIYATAGAGHLKAAEAIYEGFKKYTNHDVAYVDALDYTNPLFKKTYPEGYAFMVSKVPWFWAFMFALLDTPYLQPAIRLVRRVYNRYNAHKLERYLAETNFDYIIATQFMAVEVAAAVKRKGNISSKIIAVITDFDVHRVWLADEVDHYTAASDWTKEKLRFLGVENHRATVTGIPTNEKFSQIADRGELKRKLGVKEDVFTVLMATGSFGFGPIEEMIAKLEGFQVIVVCGHNKNLFERLSRKKNELVKVCGLVDNMHELMAVSDAMVTKPGGLSISEALVTHLPMVFFYAFPGQERGNVDVLKYYGIGLSDCSQDEMAAYLKTLQSSRDTFLTALNRTKALARPLAVQDIIKLIQ